MLQPILRRTWAPKGKTPIFIQSQRRDKVSVISAISISPKRKHLNLFFEAFPQHNINAGDIVAFLKSLGRKIFGKLILILDNWKPHRAKVLKEYFDQQLKRISVEWLPTYAPELNPVEQVWCNSKYGKLKNTPFFNLKELIERVEITLIDTRSQQELLRGFFRKAKLSL